MRGKARHVVPAKYYGKGDVINRLSIRGTKKTVGDICDLCLPDKITDIRVKRSQLPLRKKGFQLVCSNCFFKLKEENESLKGKKIIADYRTYIVFKPNKYEKTSRLPERAN